jgi:hypothetical protein
MFYTKILEQLYTTASWFVPSELGDIVLVTRIAERRKWRVEEEKMLSRPHLGDKGV